jgi:cytochrome oxidase Cu insertion factor (SCO1/SenC/PrrC family)
MKNFVWLAIICCILPILIILLISAIFGIKQKPKIPEKEFKKEEVIAEPKIGSFAPEFQLTDIDQKTFTLNDLKGKPTILFFTASYCLPCQIAAKEIKKLDEDLGGNKFNVVVIFIDKRESEEDLRVWKEKFASDDWFIAFGNEKIISDYEINYLDTRFILDERSKIVYLASPATGFFDFKEKILQLLK